MQDEQRPPNDQSPQAPSQSNSPLASNSGAGTLQINLPVGAFAGMPLVFGTPSGVSLVGARPTAVMQSWQGPYPPPEAIERYEKALPGTFDRILSMAERMEAAQIAQSAEALRSQANDVRRAHYLGAGLGALAIAGAIVMGFAGQPWLAGVFLAVPVMGLARAFVDGPRAQSQQVNVTGAGSPYSKPDAPAPK